MADSILLVDDDRSFCSVMTYVLERAGFDVLVAYSGNDGLAYCRRNRPSLIITDIHMPGLSGHQFMAEIHKLDCTLPIICITGQSAIPDAVSAIKAGAFDYLVKPFSNDELCFAIKNALDYKDLQKHPPQQSANKQQEQNQVQIIGQSRIMKALMQRIEKIAASQASVLISGESGTGKELVASALHEGSQRSAQPFIAINCSAIPRDLLESELFGHVKGSFTGAGKNHKGKFCQADKGTLFLDEIGELPLELQPKLLRVLQEREVEPIGGIPERVDVRVIAATNRNIEEALQKGRFREDLYYRLAVVPIQLPPLRERKEDIPELIEYFLGKLDTRNEIVFSAETVERLQSYDWPGNIRELRNVVEQIIILRRSNRVGISDLPPYIYQEHPLGNSLVRLPEDGYSLDKLEKEAIAQALLLSHGNKSRAAELLRISRHTLNYRIEKYKL